DLLHAAALSAPAHGLGPRHALGRAGSLAGLALRRDRRGDHPPSRRADCRALFAPAGDRGGAPVSRRAAVPQGRGGAPHARDPSPLVKVAVLAEFYPSQRDPVLGIWTHRQALAARDAGADVRVLVLHRLVPPRSSLARGPSSALGELAEIVREPRQQVRDGLPVSYLPYVSPPRHRTYPAWGAWAAPVLGLALQRLYRSFPFDVLHAHNAVP